MLALGHPVPLTMEVLDEAVKPSALQPLVVVGGGVEGGVGVAGEEPPPHAAVSHDATSKAPNADRAGFRISHNEHLARGQLYHHIVARFWQRHPPSPRENGPDHGSRGPRPNLVRPTRASGALIASPNSDTSSRSRKSVSTLFFSRPAFVRFW